MCHIFLESVSDTLNKFCNRNKNSALKGVYLMISPFFYAKKTDMSS